MARVVAVVADLMLASRVSEPLRAAGHEVEGFASIDAAAPAAAGADAIVADLDAVDAERLSALGTPTLGFYSHVEAETRNRAKAAGIEVVVPRSRMARELPDLVARLLEPPSAA